MARRNSSCCTPGAQRARKLFLEHLETRACPAFTCSFTADGLTLVIDGTPGNDYLIGIGNTGGAQVDIINLVSAAGPAVTNSCQNSNTHPSIWPPTSPPPAPNIDDFPFRIVIIGKGGNDLVDLAGNSTYGGLGNIGVPPSWANTVRSLRFYGGAGDDTFWSPVGKVTTPATATMPASVDPGLVTQPEGFAPPHIKFYGGPGQDTLHGDVDPEFFDGGFGNDFAFGSGHRDVLAGGPGNDLLYGEDGNDIIDGGTDDDDIDGGRGRDRLFGQDGKDLLVGLTGNDWIEGGPGPDTILGGEHDDVIYGGDGSDIIMGGKGDDSIRASAHSA